MAYLIDTNIAIHLRDGNEAVEIEMLALGILPDLSIISATELEGGVTRAPALADFRRAKLDEMLSTFAILSYGPAESVAYGKIVAAVGYSRPKLLDRMIAATAIVNGLTLITANAADFREIPGLNLLDWGRA